MTLHEIYEMIDAENTKHMEVGGVHNPEKYDAYELGVAHGLLVAWEIIDEALPEIGHLETLKGAKS